MTGSGEEVSHRAQSANHKGNVDRLDCAKVNNTRSKTLLRRQNRAENILGWPKSPHGFIHKIQDFFHFHH